MMTVTTHTQKNISSSIPGIRAFIPGICPKVAPAIIIARSPMDTHFFHFGQGILWGFPLLSIRNSLESPQFAKNESSVSIMSVSPSFRIRFSVSDCVSPFLRISNIRAPYLLSKSKSLKGTFIPLNLGPMTASVLCRFLFCPATAVSSGVLSDGKSLFPNNMIYSIPTTAITPPTFPSSNIENPLYPSSSIIPWTTRFVEVPMSVHIPPSIAA